MLRKKNEAELALLKMDLQVIDRILKLLFLKNLIPISVQPGGFTNV